LPARLLASAVRRLPVVALSAQNLGKVEEAIGDGTAYLGAAARVADLPAPVMRSFGPSRCRRRARSRPARPRRRALPAGGAGLSGLAAVSRLAGRLADNPWLRGGEIREARGRR